MQVFGTPGHDMMISCFIRHEAYRASLKADVEGCAHFEFARAGRFIQREEHSFVEVVDGTCGVPAQRQGAAA